MVRTTRLILIGYWDGPETRPGWPRAEDFVDPEWNAEDREEVVDYLRRGHVARSFMGESRCRLCAQPNGSLEFSDGVCVWPEGLSHYLSDHTVRLPERFVQHVRARLAALEEADRDEEWWAEVG